MKIECPECHATSSVDDLYNSPAEHVCEECGACFELESHLVFEEKRFGSEEIQIPLGE